ncbi:class F sortase [Streptomyces sp. URMC 129]|uniref:class F sortase n=1 Tax=Streptomyces sp. URMC 129 TaxID=3423407 RepID=UPI003F1B21AD
MKRLRVLFRPLHRLGEWYRRTAPRLTARCRARVGRTLARLRAALRLGPAPAPASATAEGATPAAPPDQPAPPGRTGRLGRLLRSGRLGRLGRLGALVRFAGRRHTLARPPRPVVRPSAQTRQQRLSVRCRRLETLAATSAVTVGLLAGLFGPDPEDGVSEARESSSIAEGVSRPGAVDAPAAAPDSGSTANLDQSLTGEPSSVVAPPLPRSAPTRVRIPQLATDVEVFGADLSPDGGPPSPSVEDALRAAWYAGGVAPGERGAAILVGHLDTYDGPAAFAGLGSLRPGENIEIDREDGSTAIFTVDSVEQYPKTDFPDERVYGTVDTPQLRLITCGGRWTQDGGYDSNIVAYARLTGSANVQQPGMNAP